MYMVHRCPRFPKQEYMNSYPEFADKNILETVPQASW